ncbi:MAG: glycosyltransferase [Caldilineaceae bacterium]
MRAAVVTPYLPWPADTGGKLRSYYLIKGLAAQAEVDLYTVCYGTPPPAGDLLNFCHSVQILPLTPPPRKQQFVRLWLDKSPRSVRFFQDQQSLVTIPACLEANYDVLICDEIAMASYFTSLHHHDGTPRVIMRQKIDHLHYREMAESRRWGKERLLDHLEADRLQRYEEAMMPHFDGAVFGSPGDGAIAAAQGPDLQIEVIVNGADVDYFVPNRQPDPDPTLLLLGTMHYQPNIDMVRYFFRTMYPALRRAVPKLQILIVGHMSPPEIAALADLPGVTVTGSVADVRPYINRSWLQVVPLRLGGGTRLKIIEAMAAELPVVSTTVGAQGLDELSHSLVTIADSPEEFIAATEALLANPTRRAELAKAGRTAVVERYAWQSLGRRYADFCLGLGRKS